MSKGPAVIANPDEGQHPRTMPPENVAALKQWIALRRTESPPSKRSPQAARHAGRSFNIKVAGKKLEMLVTEEKVTSRKVKSIVPPGHRPITPNEGALFWMNSEEFRSFLDQSSYLWTGEKSLKTRGPHVINADGTFTSKGLIKSYRESSMHVPGGGVVALGSERVGSGGSTESALRLNARQEGGTRLRVAYTKRETGAKRRK